MKKGRSGKAQDRPSPDPRRCLPENTCHMSQLAPIPARRVMRARSSPDHHSLPHRPHRAWLALGRAERCLRHRAAPLLSRI